MTCNNNSSANPDDRLLIQQEHRHISRLWNQAIQRLSTSGLDFLPKLDEVQDLNDDIRRGVHFREQDPNVNACEPETERRFPSETIQKKLGKGKSLIKVKSPLQKFDEVVTRELTNRRMSEEGGMPSFEGTQKWSSLQYSGSRVSDFGRSKISVENKVSRGALHGMEKEVKDADPSDVQNAVLMDAVEKLAQAQAFCRFESAVKAAEAATASVPPEMAEEVAVACAKDYQAEIVDVINEKMPSAEERSPMEVIGYIGVTKLKDNV